MQHAIVHGVYLTLHEIHLKQIDSRWFTRVSQKIHTEKNYWYRHRYLIHVYIYIHIILQMECRAQEKGYNEFVQTVQCRLQDCHDMYFHVETLTAITERFQFKVGCLWCVGGPVTWLGWRSCDLVGSLTCSKQSWDPRSAELLLFRFCWQKKRIQCV